MRKLKDIIAGREIVAVKATQSVLDAARLMTGKHVGAVMVTAGRRLEGILTERDIITRVVALGQDPADMSVAEVMTKDPTVMAPDKPFSHALLLMSGGGFRHMPVVEAGKLVGVVSIRDAIGVEHEELDRLLDDLEAIAVQL